LEALLTEDHVELFALAKGEGAGVTLTPLDRWSDPARDSEHRSTQVDADNAPSLTQAFLGKPCNDASSTRDIENAISRGERNIVDEEFRKRAKEWTDERPFEHLRKAQLSERNRHITSN
jgi:hypothetical protein